jgi:hypothetical protein
MRAPLQRSMLLTVAILLSLLQTTAADDNQ